MPDDRPACDETPYCDHCLTRTAVLALRLRKLSARLHADLKHTGDWLICQADPCRASAAALLHSIVDEEDEEAADGEAQRAAG